MIVLDGLLTAVNDLAISPDGRAVLANGGGASGRAAVVWTLPEGGRPARTIDVVGLGFADGGASLDAMRYGRYGPRFGTISLRPAGTFCPREAVTWTRGWPNWARLSPDRTRLVAGVQRARLDWWSWPDLSPQPPWPLDHCDGFTAADLAFSPDGSAVAVGQHSAVTAHEAATGRLLWCAQVSGAVWLRCVGWSPDGRFVAAGGGTRLFVFDSAGTRLVEHTQPSKHFLDLEFTRDGRFLATVSNERTVKFWDTDSWQLRHELAWQIGGLRALAFSRDGMLAAAGGVGKKVVVWDLDL